MNHRHDLVAAPWFHLDRDVSAGSQAYPQPNTRGAENWFDTIARYDSLSKFAVTCGFWQFDEGREANMSANALNTPRQSAAVPVRQMQ